MNNHKHNRRMMSDSFEEVGNKSVEKNYSHSDEITNYPNRQLNDRISKVQMVPIEHIIPTENSEEARVNGLTQHLNSGGQLPAIITEFAYNDKNPDLDALAVVDGHHRLEAARRMGMTHVPVRIRVPAEDWESVKQSGGFKLNFGKSKKEAPSLHKAPIEYSPEPNGISTHPIKNPNENWTQIHEQPLPNGLIYKQFKRDDAFQHHIVDPSTNSSVATVHTRAIGHPDYSAPQEHQITWAQTSPSHKGKGLGRQAYLAALVHGKGVTQLNSGKELSLKGHQAWSTLKDTSGLKVNLAPYATDEAVQLNPEAYDRAAAQNHSMRIHDAKGLDHGKMFPKVDVGAKEEPMAASEKLEKANVKPRPMFVGEISEDRKNIGILHPDIGLTWDATPEIKKYKDDHTISTAREWLKTQNPEHHQLLKDFVNHVMQSPNRHLRFGSDYQGGPETPKQRHIHQMVSNHEDAKLTIHSPNSLTLSVKRHGTVPKISNFHFDNEKKIVKSESLCYNGLYGHYNDFSGNGHRFYIDGGGLSSALGKTEKGSEPRDGQIRFSRRPEKFIVDRVCDLLKSFGHGSLRGDVWGELQKGNERSDGAPQGDGALLLKGEMNTKKYSLKYHAPKGQGAYGLHTVTAHDHNGNVVGELSAEDLGDGSFQANMVEVHPEHRRRGIAGAMYDHMQRKANLKAVPDLEAQTGDARKFWANRKIKKSEQIYNSLQKASHSSKLLAALGLAASTALPMAQMAPQTITPKEAYSQYPSSRKDIDLRSIAQVESRGGKDTKHKTVQSGLNAGSAALGAYGLMPITIKEIIQKNPQAAKYKHLANASDEQIKNYAKKNPNFEKDIASANYDAMSQKFGGDFNKIGHSWLNGPTGTERAIRAGKPIQSHWHVKKLNNAKNKIMGIADPVSEPIAQNPKKRLP